MNEARGMQMDLRDPCRSKRFIEFCRERKKCQNIRKPTNTLWLVPLEKAQKSGCGRCASMEEIPGGYREEYAA